MADDPKDPPPDPDDQGARWRLIEEQARAQLLGPAAAPPELERVGRLAQRDHLASLPAFAPHPFGSLRCDACGAQLPADLTVCFSCGHAARPLTRPSPHLLIIGAISDPDAMAHVSRVLIAAQLRISPAELHGALSEPPAVFICDAAPEQLHAICASLELAGVAASASRADTRGLDAPGVSIMREVLESVWRDAATRRQWAVILALGALLTFYAPLFGGLVLVAAAIALYMREAARYMRRHSVEPLRLLDELSGLGEHAPRVSRALGALRDDPSRRQLTACLISYHAIRRHIASTDPVQRRLLSRLRLDLDDLLRQLLDACTRYGELSAYAASYDLAALDGQLAQLEEAPPVDPRALELRQRQLTQRRAQRDTLAQVIEQLPLLREQLGAMAAALEALRARTVSLTLRRATADAEDSELAHLLFDLDEEVEVFEHTIASLATISSR